MYWHASKSQKHWVANGSEGPYWCRRRPDQWEARIQVLGAELSLAAQSCTGGGRQSDRESEAVDLPSYENSASSGLRSTTEQTKTNPKVRLEEEGIKKSWAAGWLDFTRLSANNYFPVLIFLQALVYKVEREKCEGNRLVSPRFQDPPLNPCNTVQWYVNVDYYCYVSFSNVTTLYFSH